MIGMMLAAAVVPIVPPLLPDHYTIICQTTLAVGMEWTKGEWEPTRYKPNRYVVTNALTNSCSLQTKQKSDLTPDHNFRYRQVCLNIRDMGNTYMPSASEYCMEYYFTEGVNKGATISCAGEQSETKMTLAPDGEFNRSTIVADVSGTAAYKDSQSIETGNCSLVR